MNEGLLDRAFTEDFLEEAAGHEGLVLGRVCARSRELYRVATRDGEMLARPSGRLRHRSPHSLDEAAVGDYVMLGRVANSPDRGTIEHILTRKSVFVRRAAGTAGGLQVVAANLDTVFVCMALNRDFNLRRLERYLAVAWDSGAVPVVVLTKADLCDRLAGRLEEVAEAAPGTDVLVTAALTDGGFQAVLPYVSAGRTVAFLGSSGVGKSTLINRLLGADTLVTRETRRDDRGRHATTVRQLMAVPAGGAVIDTPGMRELGVDGVNLSRAFPDIAQLAGECRFRDCRHEQEPGCAVRQAIGAGRLSEQRLASYRKLQKEARYDAMDSRRIEAVKIRDMYGSFGGVKNARAYLKSKKANRCPDAQWNDRKEEK